MDEIPSVDRKAQGEAAGIALSTWVSRLVTLN